MEISSIDISAATIQKISNERTRAGQVNLSVLRLDKIHPVISGNKWFKFKYYLQDAMSRGIKITVDIRRTLLESYCPRLPWRLNCME